MDGARKLSPGSDVIHEKNEKYLTKAQ